MATTETETTSDPHRSTLTFPALMGVLNVSPESFSDGTTIGDADERIATALAMVDDGATIIDIGGQSATTDNAELSVTEEIDRILPVLRGLRGQTGALVSIDTYRARVAEACLDAGADIINDISGLRDPDMAGVIARHDAQYVLMHNRGVPKVRLTESHLYDDVVDDVATFLHARRVVLGDQGVRDDQIIVDPGLDFSKTPRQTIETIHRLDEIGLHGGAMLLAVSRKDFIGALSGAAPRDRDPGTLATIAAIMDRVPRAIFRVHDVRGAAQYLTVRAALADPESIDAELRLDAHNFRS